MVELLFIVSAAVALIEVPRRYIKTALKESEKTAREAPLSQGSAGKPNRLK